MPDEERLQTSEAPPTWNLGDVLLIAMMFFTPVLLFSLFLGGHPYLLLPIQGLSYLISLLCARVVISLKTGKGLLESIDWNYPGQIRLPQLLLAGLALSVVISFFSAVLLPIPKNLPIEKLFATRTLAILSMTFATLVAPIAEEIFFRGIFYGAVRSTLESERLRKPMGAFLLVLSILCVVLAWRGSGSGYLMFAPILLAMGILLLPFREESAPLRNFDRHMLIAVVLTATLFAFVHGAQLAHSWGPLLSVFIVGMVLTLVRVYLNSVAASWLIHMAYNGTLFLMTWAGTSGFRKLG